MSDALLLRFVVTLPLLLASLVAHELAHGWVAARLGDPTPRLHGRLTLNPLKHLDPWGSALLVLTFVGSGGMFFFGWAKPVQISPWRFRDPQRGMMWVGLAGPASNALLAVAAGVLVWATYSSYLFAAQVFALAFLLNVILATFNLIPLPPLDGSRVVGGLLPRELYPRWVALDRYGNYTILLLLLVMVASPRVFDATIGAVLDAAIRLLPGA